MIRNTRPEQQQGIIAMATFPRRRHRKAAVSFLFYMIHLLFALSHFLDSARKWNGVDVDYNN